MDKSNHPSLSGFELLGIETQEQYWSASGVGTAEPELKTVIPKVWVDIKNPCAALR
jgi:hypothetical protein